MSGLREVRLRLAKQLIGLCHKSVQGEDVEEQVKLGGGKQKSCTGRIPTAELLDRLFLSHTAALEDVPSPCRRKKVVHLHSAWHVPRVWLLPAESSAICFAHR